MAPDQMVRYAPFDRVHTGHIRTTIVVSSGLRVNDDIEPVVNWYNLPLKRLFSVLNFFQVKYI